MKNKKLPNKFQLTVMGSFLLMIAALFLQCSTEAKDFISKEAQSTVVISNME